MQKGTDTISLPVIAFDTGEKFDQIRDVIFGQHENRVLGFLVDEGGVVQRGQSRSIPECPGHWAGRRDRAF